MSSSRLQAKKDGIDKFYLDLIQQRKFKSAPFGDA